MTPTDPCSPAFQEAFSRMVGDALDIARSLPREGCEGAFRAVLDGMDALTAEREVREMICGRECANTPDR
jgi:hypothetical protein